MLKRFFARLEIGQAIIEYMPTIAGAMVVAMLSGVYLGGGVKESYCKIVDVFGDRPEACTDGDTPETPDESDDPVEKVCTITLDSAEGDLAGGGWNTEWQSGESDTLNVTVSGLQEGESVAYTATRSFLNDSSVPKTEVAGGTFSVDGTYPINISYPAEDDWGAAPSDGSGVYQAQIALSISDPCDDLSWVRTYNPDQAADLEIAIMHLTSPLTTAGEELTYVVGVGNNGPNEVNEFNNEAVVVNLPVPAGVTIKSVTPTQGECDTQIVCDLGPMGVLDTAQIVIVAEVKDPSTCELTAKADVSAARPDDPNSSNNEAITIPYCEPEETTCVTYKQLGVATDYNVFTFGNFTGSSDTEGRLAVGKNASLTNYSVGAKLSSAWVGKDVLIVGGNLSSVGGQVDNGNVAVGGSVLTNADASPIITVKDGSMSTSSPVDFNAAATELKALSAKYASAATTGKVEFQTWGSLDLTGENADLNVFNVNTNQFKGAMQVRITIPDGATALINITGDAAVEFPTWGYFINGSQVANPRVLYNLPSATSVTMNGSVFGSVLAPNAAVTFNNGQLNGTLVAASFSGPGQTNYVPFVGCVPN